MNRCPIFHFALIMQINYNKQLKNSPQKTLMLVSMNSFYYQLKKNCILPNNKFLSLIQSSFCSCILMLECPVNISPHPKSTEVQQSQQRVGLNIQLSVTSNIRHYFTMCTIWTINSLCLLVPLYLPLYELIDPHHIDFTFSTIDGQAMP